MSKLIKVTVRDAGEELHLECRFDDGQKFAAITVDAGHESLAHEICDFLNIKSSGALARMIETAPKPKEFSGRFADAIKFRDEVILWWVANAKPMLNLLRRIKNARPLLPAANAHDELLHAVGAYALKKRRRMAHW